jgi:ABC-type ATPase involved in cell division
MEKPIFKITIETDKFTEAASTAFDYTFTGESIFEGHIKPDIPEQFGIGLIVGPSGSGKSLLLKQFGQEDNPEWLPTKAIVSHFETPDDAVNKLMAVGLNSIPSWCKPFHVLSNGEQFRASLARKLHNDSVIDEFTSVVDRNVAKAACVALRRYVDNNKLSGIVLASCHSDILEWLRPDWYFDTTNGMLHDGRLLRRPKIELRIYPCKRSTWGMFAKHHYLSSNLNKSCRAYLCTAVFGNSTDEVVVGFASTISFPHAKFKNGYRGHRTVILPDFQGLGIGPRLSNMIAELHLQQGKRYFSRTAHPRFIAYRDNSPVWKRLSKNTKVKASKGTAKKSWNINEDRVCCTHEYIGKGSNV